MSLLEDLYVRSRAFLVGRAVSYVRTFPRESVDARVVLEDLSRFCRAHSSTAHPDPHVAARLDGRREVWLRIAAHLNLDNDALWALFDGRPPPPSSTNQRGNDE